MIISVHLPKTAGGSFGASLKQCYGDSFQRDYNDIPLNTPPYKRNRTALRYCISNAEKDFSNTLCIHGHFLPIKYLLLSTLRNISFVTWLRNPVERLLSHYNFWNEYSSPLSVYPLHRKMVMEKWSLERFCLGPELKNLYTQFLFGFPLEHFDFIGITEFYDMDFNFFHSHFTKKEIQPQKINVGRKQMTYDLDISFRKEIEHYHSKDMRLYTRALKRREFLLSTMTYPSCPERQ